MVEYQAPLQVRGSWEWKDWLSICACTTHILWLDLTTSICLTLSSQVIIYLSVPEGPAHNTSKTHESPPQLGRRLACQ